MGLKSFLKSRVGPLAGKISGKIGKAEERIGISPSSERRYRRTVSQIFSELEKVKDKENDRYAVLGVGNDLKGDDAVGWYVVDRLEKRFSGDHHLLRIKTSVPENHVREITDFAPKHLVVVDAADFGLKPGSVKVVREYQIKGSALSSHSSPLTVFLRLYQEGETTNRPVTIIGVQKKENEFGQPMSEEVMRTGEMLADIIGRLYENKILDIALEKEIMGISNPLERMKYILSRIGKNK